MPDTGQKYLASQRKFKVMIHATVNNAATYDIQADKSGFIGEINGQEFRIDALRDGNKFHILWNGRSYNAELLSMDMTSKTIVIKVGKTEYPVVLKDRFDDLLRSLGMEGAGTPKVSEVKAPMPGMVLNIMVEDGQEVEKDQPLIILEAMKMENVIKSPIQGIIRKVEVSKGIAVEKNTILISFVNS
jgi:biotin carboxyl carrier protein